MLKSESMNNQILNNIKKIAGHHKEIKNISSLVPDAKEYKHLSDPDNINNKRTIKYTENVKKNRYT